MAFTDTESAQAQVHMQALREDADQRRRVRLAQCCSAAALSAAALLYRLRRRRR